MTKLMKQSGFTLIEIIVSVTILSIVSALAAPSLASLINHNKTKAASILFQDNLRQARYDSKTNSSSTVVFCAVRANNNQRCVAGSGRRAFSNGWQWFIENGTNNQYNPNTDTLLGNTFETSINNIDIRVRAADSDKILANRIIFNNGLPTIEDESNVDLQPVITFMDDAGRFSTVSFDITGRSTLKHH